MADFNSVRAKKPLTSSRIFAVFDLINDIGNIDPSPNLKKAFIGCFSMSIFWNKDISVFHATSDQNLHLSF